MNAKLIAICAIVTIVVATAAVVTFSGDSDDSEGITITDGSGKKVTLSEPLSNVCVINGNIPKAMIMLGIDDVISCYHYSKTLGIKAEQDKNARLGTYYTPSVEALISYGVQAVLCPVASMTLYASTEKACENNGIAVIRLDCNGDSLFDDLNKISALFGEPDSAKTALRTYSDDYSAVVAAVRSALADRDRLDYLCTVQMTAGGVAGSMYNVNSAISALYEGAFGRNVTSYTNLSTASVLNVVNDGSIEAVSKVMDKVQVFIMRSSDIDNGDALYADYVGSASSGCLVTTTSPAYQENRIFVINSDIMSGLYGHIGLLVAATMAYGITIGGYGDVNGLVHGFQEKYGQALIEDGELLALQYGAGYPADANGELRYSSP